MAEVVIVALALGGVSAYVWSVIAQTHSPPGASADGTRPLDASAGASLPAPWHPRDVLARLRGWDLRPPIRAAARHAAAAAVSAARMARAGTRMVRARWARRARRSFEPKGRRIRFEETAELTGPAELPLVGNAAVLKTGGVWQDRPSRLLATIELVVLIVVVSAVVAAMMFGLGELVARAVENGKGA